MSDIIKLSTKQDNFGFVDSDFSKGTYIYLPYDSTELLVILREFSLINEFSVCRAKKIGLNPNEIGKHALLGIIGRAAATTNVVTLALDFDNKKNNENYRLAKKEFLETGEVKGYEVYLVNLNRKVWIGKEDWKDLGLIAENQ